MNRFFLKQNHLKGKDVHFPPDISHQILHVLRLGAGEEVQVLDNQGQVHLVRLKINGTPDNLTGQIVVTEPATGEPQTIISLCFGLSNRDKVEWILQKATEVGVSGFYPFISSRTLVQSTTLSKSKQERWERIIREAAEQSGRGRLPELHPALGLMDCLQVVEKAHTHLLAAWEASGSKQGASLSTALKGRIDSLALFVGPEGGFSRAEVHGLMDSGCEVVSLGERILRMETAAIVFPALVLYHYGEM